MPFWNKLLHSGKKKKVPDAQAPTQEDILPDDPVFDIPPNLLPGVSRDDFDPLTILGKGTFATVILVRSNLKDRIQNKNNKLIANDVERPNANSCSNSKSMQSISVDNSNTSKDNNDNNNNSDPIDGGFYSGKSNLSSNVNKNLNDNNTGKLYAMKIVHKHKLINIERVKDVFTERDVLARASHPFLIKLHYTFQSERKLFFVMDYMPGGDLRAQINCFRQRREPMPYDMVRLYAAEITLALTHLHDHGILYRDLKPENILLDEMGHCALADFGLSKDFGAIWADDGDPNNADNNSNIGGNNNASAEKRRLMRTASFVGSPLYVAPEVLKREKYSTSVDFWGLGVLIYTLLFGAEPFRGKTHKEIFDQILMSNVRYPTSIPTTPEACDIIERLLCKFPKGRLRSPEIFVHPFFRGMDFDAIMKKKIAPSAFIRPPDALRDIPRSNYYEPNAHQGFNEVYTPDPSQAPLINGTQQQLFENFSWANVEMLMENCEELSGDNSIAIANNSKMHSKPKAGTTLASDSRKSKDSNKPILSSVTDNDNQKTLKNSRKSQKSPQQQQIIPQLQQFNQQRPQ